MSVRTCAMRCVRVCVAVITETTRAAAIVLLAVSITKAIAKATSTDGKTRKTTRTECVATETVADDTCK